MPSVYPILFTNSSKWLRYASDLGVRCTNDYFSNHFGTPFFTSIMTTLERIVVEEISPPSAFVGYTNCDLLFHSQLISSLHYIQSQMQEQRLPQEVVLMGRRYNRDTSRRDSIEGLDVSAIDQFIEKEIRFSDLFITVAQDYFLFSTGTFPYSSLLDVVIGRNGYDNYLVDYCLTHNITLIDSSHSSKCCNYSIFPPYVIPNQIIRFPRSIISSLYYSPNR